MARVHAAVGVCLSVVAAGCAVSDLPPASRPAPASAPAPAPAPAAMAARRSAEPETHAETRSPSPDPSPSDAELEARFKRTRALSVSRGQATFYGDAFAGRLTASGERFDPRAFTAAHRTLPFGTVVRVVCPKSRRAVYVRINDRGPFGNRRRIIDLSRAAAERLDILRWGVADVRLEVLELGRRRR